MIATIMLSISVLNHASPLDSFMAVQENEGFKISAYPSRPLNAVPSPYRPIYYASDNNGGIGLPGQEAYPGKFRGWCHISGEPFTVTKSEILVGGKSVLTIRPGYEWHANIEPRRNPDGTVRALALNGSKYALWDGKSWEEISGQFIPEGLDPALRHLVIERTEQKGNSILTPPSGKKELLVILPMVRSRQVVPSPGIGPQLIGFHGTTPYINYPRDQVTLGSTVLKGEFDFGQGLVTQGGVMNAILPNGSVLRGVKGGNRFREGIKSGWGGINSSSRSNWGLNLPAEFSLVATDSEVYVLGSTQAFSKASGESMTDMLTSEEYNGRLTKASGFAYLAGGHPTFFTTNSRGQATNTLRYVKDGSIRSATFAGLSALTEHLGRSPSGRFVLFSATGSRGSQAQGKLYALVDFEKELWIGLSIPDEIMPPVWGGARAETLMVQCGATAEIAAGMNMFQPKSLVQIDPDKVAWRSLGK